MGIDNCFEDKTQDTSIFDYLKGHHSVVIACVSGIVAIISFLSRASSYISQKILFIEYRIPAQGIICQDLEPFLITMVASLVPFMSLLLAYATISQHYYRYYKYDALNRFIRACNKENKVEDEKIDIPSQHTVLNTIRALRRQTAFAVIFSILFLALVGIIFDISIGSYDFMSLSYGLAFSVIAIVAAISQVRLETKDIRPQRIRILIQNIYKETDAEQKKTQIKHIIPYYRKKLKLLFYPSEE